MRHSVGLLEEAKKQAKSQIQVLWRTLDCELFEMSVKRTVKVSILPLNKF